MTSPFKNNITTENFLAKFLPFLVSSRQPTLPDNQIRKLGLLYSTYRFVISVFLFLSSYAVIFEHESLTVKLPSLLQQSVLLFYGLFSFLLLAFFLVIRSNASKQLAIGLVIDVIFLSILLFINGAPDIQLLILYMVVVAASFMLLVPYQALIITLLAVIFVIYFQFFQALDNDFSVRGLGEAVLMSFSFIFVGFLSLSISSRLAHVEKKAAENESEITRMNVITQEVIRKMTQGVLVLDNKQEVMISNTAANTLLNLTVDYLNPDSETSESGVNQFDLIYTSQQNITQQITEHHPDLVSWLKQAVLKTQSHLIYKLPTSHATLDKLRITATPLHDDMVLVMLEDLRREQTNAQQLKLASLGQLTASIAHEIRNPLAAISQASQLLMLDNDTDWNTQNQNFDKGTDQTQLNEPDPNHELYDMIFNQTKRVNRIIEDVLKLSRQAKPEQSKLDIVVWLETFIANHYREHDVFLHPKTHPILYFDPHQLEQILVNLINNGLRFSSKSHPHAFVEIEVSCIQDDVVVDVLDTGAGVKKEKQADLFMPFFTTDNEGTGLGLYLSQAFAEANFSKLVYIPEHDKTCFRLIIPQAIPDNTTDDNSLIALSNDRDSNSNDKNTDTLGNIDINE